MTRIILASASPRRRELLDRIGVEFDVRAPDIDEAPLDGETPVDYVRRIAAAKAAVIEVVADELVIAADTTVDVDGRILAKPDDADHAAAMLAELSGRTHLVHTGVAVRRGEDTLVDVCTTEVTFAALDAALIEWYVATGEPLGKAGAYALQGAGAALVHAVRGSVTNVVGLPLDVVVDLAHRCGTALLTPPP